MFNDVSTKTLWELNTKYRDDGDVAGVKNTGAELLRRTDRSERERPITKGERRAAEIWLKAAKGEL